MIHKQYVKRRIKLLVSIEQDFGDSSTSGDTEIRNQKSSQKICGPY